MLWLFHSLLHLELLQHVTECNGMTLRLCPMAFLVLSVSSTESKVNIDTGPAEPQGHWDNVPVLFENLFSKSPKMSRSFFIV